MTSLYSKLSPITYRYLHDNPEVLKEYQDRVSEQPEQNTQSYFDWLASLAIFIGNEYRKPDGICQQYDVGFKTEDLPIQALQAFTDSAKIIIDFG